ncbi:MAG TPA: 50S ribosomal protein L23 [Candidatus Nanoarchaeia archaeon]|nr:50S ribosomal protein L23 [Candidatus Nanoarchaeia archaeon]
MKNKENSVISLKPLSTEKAIMMVESQNVLTFRTEKERTKNELKKEIESLFDVKVEKIKTSIKNNQKRAYVKLKKEFPAIDIATKLGLI